MFQVTRCADLLAFPWAYLTQLQWEHRITILSECELEKEMLQNFKITLKLQRVRILNQRQVAAKIQQLEEAFLSQPGGSEGSGDSGEESGLPASSAEGARGCHDAGWAEV